MKKSMIPLLSALILIVVYLGFPALRGQIALRSDNQPADVISAFWMKKYELELGGVLPSGLKHLKIIGSSGAPNLQLDIVHKLSGDSVRTANSFSSMNPQSYRYEIHSDTLVIKVRSYTALTVGCESPFESITCTDRCNVSLDRIQTEKMKIEVSGNSTLVLGKRAYTDQKDGFDIDSVAVSIQNGSEMTLRHVKLKNVVAAVDNGQLHYYAYSKIDTLTASLHGKSTVATQDIYGIHEIKNLLVSGDKTYFNTKLIGKGVNFIDNDL